MPRTITNTFNVYASEYCTLTPQEMHTADSAKVADALQVWPTSWGRQAGYSLVGTAEVTMTLHDMDAVISNKVESLKEEKQRVIADAQAKATKLESQIQQLLAITYEAA